MALGNGQGWNAFSAGAIDGIFDSFSEIKNIGIRNEAIRQLNLVVEGRNADVREMNGLLREHTEAGSFWNVSASNLKLDNAVSNAVLYYFLGQNRPKENEPVKFSTIRALRNDIKAKATAGARAITTGDAGAKLRQTAYKTDVPLSDRHAIRLEESGAFHAPDADMAYEKVTDIRNSYVDAGLDNGLLVDDLDN